MREDLLDIITVTAPLESPFLSSLGERVPMSPDKARGLKFWDKVMRWLWKVDVDIRPHIGYSEEDFCGTVIWFGPICGLGAEIRNRLRGWMKKRGYEQKYKVRFFNYDGLEKHMEIQWQVECHHEGFADAIGHGPTAKEISERDEPPKGEK